MNMKYCYQLHLVGLHGSGNENTLYLDTNTKTVSEKYLRNTLKGIMRKTQC